MFVLANLVDTIRIEAKEFRKEAATAIHEAINVKFANKVLQDVGLCVCLHDLLSCSAGKVRWGDGCLYYQVTFRLVVFRPMIGEVLLGKIKSSNEDGIRVSMGFYDDIYIPATLIPSPRGYDHTERAWFWVLNPADDEQIEQDPLMVPKEDRAYLDRDEPIRFRVEADEFHEAEPGPVFGEGKAVTAEHAAKPKEAPYVVIGGITSSGLGLPSWWSNAEQVMEE
ncbi:hypothetical protein K437DRAFT_279105 [Tilletiaria anomala UBC 951]|uniref:Polymerase III polypeptide H n=1 Tax=Tilletiaria anomala (strain ATCC 24038 / CBS 436.72 / UBC 951) TaxID=1037660 RepID=A0A066VHC0_TILAU|nr:uncharacterized protein K437DRAFT_279105 [Tilletiaria anomala UBC 951]KDN41137.1 hypothetical protein K437DRAFT_279105 [Tilletiaria anomala UBC 951]